MKKNESGRSMIEMLGVLAIIGVLSIGGLAGYTMAMKRNRVNVILDYLSRVAVNVQTSGDVLRGVNLSGDQLNCETWVDDAIPAEIDFNLDGNCEIATNPFPTIDTVVISLFFADEAFCEAFVSRVGTGTTGTYISSGRASCTDDEGIEIVYSSQ